MNWAQKQSAQFYIKHQWLIFGILSRKPTEVRSRMAVRCRIDAFFVHATFSLQQQQATRDCLIVAIDARRSMFEKEVQFGEETMSRMRLVLKAYSIHSTIMNRSTQAVFNLICAKCVACDRDYVSIFFFNTDTSTNEHNFEHAVMWQKLDEPTSQMARDLLALCDVGLYFALTTLFIEHICRGLRNRNATDCRHCWKRKHRLAECDVAGRSYGW